MKNFRSALKPLILHFMPNPYLKLPNDKEQTPYDSLKDKITLITNPKPSSNSLPSLSWKQKLLIIFLFAVSLFYCETCYPDADEILSVSPQSHSFGRFWEKSKAAQMRTLAMLIEMYPDYELYFLERDATLLGQTGLAISQIESDDALKKRIHFLKISRKNIKDPLLVDYLKQEGISDTTLAAGKKFLFVDTGFVGSLPRTIMKHFPAHEDQFGVHMMVAAADDQEWRSPFPSARVFGTSYSETYPLQDIFEGAIDVVHPYARLPKADLRAESFERLPNGRIVPVASLSSRDENDGEINPSKTRAYEEDLQFSLRQSSSRLLLDKLRNEWRTARDLWASGKKEALINELKRWTTVKGAQGLAMALDFMEITHTNLVGDFTITPTDLGIQPQEFNYNEKRLTKKNLPIWKPKLCRTLFHHLTAPPPSATLFPE